MAIIEAPLKQVMFLHMDTANEAIPDGFALCDGSTLNSTQQDINPGGNYTVPDLRNNFILCADSTKAFGTAGVAVGNGNLNLAAGAPGPGGVGGAHSHTITTTEMPSHTHTASTSGSVTITDPGHNHTVTDLGHGHTVTDAGHSHTTSVSTIGDHNHGITDPGHFHVLKTGQSAGFAYIGNPATGINTGSENTDTATTGISINNAGSHTHTVTVNSATTGIALATSTTGITVNNRTTGITASLSATTTNTSTGGGSAFDLRPRYYGLVAIIRVKA